MERVVSKTVDALTKLGERIERRLSTDADEYYSSGLERSGSGLMFSGSDSAFHRPFDNTNFQASKRRDLFYDGARRSSSDNLAAMPSNDIFQQNSMANPYADGFRRHPYGTGIRGPSNYGYSGQSGAIQYGNANGNVGYAPNYYIAERRQVELVPAPPPRYIQQPVPVPVPVDRPVPQPYPVQVPVKVFVDRPVPVPVPSPVPVDRPVPVPVPVPSPVPCYVPVAVPVPSPPPSPVMVENSVTYTQRWADSSSAAMNQNYRAGSPVMMNQQYELGSPVMLSQDYRAGSPIMMNQQQYLTGQSAMGMNPYAVCGHSSLMR